MKSQSSSQALLAVTFIVLTSVVSAHSAESVAPLIDALVQRADAWQSVALPGQWQAMEGASGSNRKEATTAEPVFGVPAQRLIATEAAGKLSRLDVLYMERGAAVANDAYLQTMRQTAAKVSAGVQAKVGKARQLLKPAAGTLPGTVIQEWSAPAATIRLTMEPGTRLWISMTAQVPSATAKPAMAFKDILKARVVQKENGDVLITEFPEVAREDDDNTGDDELRVAECLAGFYAWRINIEATGVAAGWSRVFNMDDSPKFFAAIIKAAKVRNKTSLLQNPL